MIQQEIFDRLYFYSQNELEYDTYEFLPRDGTKYPFVEIGETDLNSNAIKSAYSGLITQTINVWGNQDMRFLVAKMMKSFLLNRIQTENYTFDLTNVNQRILPDSSVPNTRLFHGVLTLEYTYMKGR